MQKITTVTNDYKPKEQLKSIKSGTVYEEEIWEAYTDWFVSRVTVNHDGLFVHSNASG